MDFAALPPEINSSRMYAGPGSGPLLAAAGAWDGLAADLYSTASSYSSVVSGLTSGPWLGPAAAAMAAATAPYVAWLGATAAQAEQAAAQAKAAAAAFEAAFAMTVPPLVIAANRSLLMALIATNFFGQNTPAIAATEAHYTEMWAQDAAAMYGYAGASAAASTLTPFTSPPPTANPGGLPQAVAGSQLINMVPNALHWLVSSTPSSGLSPVDDLQLASLPALLARIGTTPATYLASAVGGNTVGQRLGMMQALQAVGSALGPEALGKLGGLGALGGPGAGLPVSASMGQASSLGGLSVPRSWGAAAPAIKPVAVILSSTGATPAVAAGGQGTPWTQMALSAIAGRAVGAVASRARTTVVPRMPAAG